MKLDKRYTRDDTVGMELEDSPWKAIATTSALIAGGVLAYKSGLLKKGVSQLIEAAGHSSGKTMDNIVAMKNWANSKDLSEQFSKSLIRNSGLISFDTMFTKKGIQEISSFGKKLLDPASRADVIRATTDDLSYISKQLKDRATTEAMRKKGTVLNKIDDTQLFRLNNRINDNIEEITRDVSDKAGKSASRQSTEDLMKKMIITDEATKRQLKKSGHRAMTINDLGEYGRNDLGTYFSPSEHGMNFSDTLMNSIRELGEKEFTDADGNIKKLIDSNEFGKMSIDPALLINEKGKIADLRNLKNGFQDGVEMMATQFQVPVIGLNPLRLFGLDGIKDTIDDFGVFSAGTRQSAFKASTEIISKPYLLSGGGVFDIAEDGVMTKIKSNVSATRLFRDNRFNSRQTEALIKMHGIPKNDIVEFTAADGFINNMKGKIGRTFDIGRSDIRNKSHRDLGLGDFLNPNNYIEKFTDGLFRGFKGAKEGSSLRDGILRTYKKSTPKYASNIYHLAPEVDNIVKTSTKNIDDAMAKLLDAEEAPILIAMNNSIKLTDAVLGRNDATVGKFFGQFVAGRNNLGDVTSTTLSSFHVVERVNATLNIAGIGLSTQSLSNSPAILKNLILKRALPVVGAYNAFEYVNHMTEDEETGDNITKKAARGIVNTKLTVAKFRDFTGITDVAKKISEYTPGSDQLTELPGINTLDFDKSEEELKDYYENGYDPIRKGRYWDIGIQAFTGSKINYYRPNWYRRTMADVKFSDSQYGSREEYFDNAALPTPGHLLAPVRHFITDRYHWDKKHYQDRPYPITAPAFSNVPVVGPLLGSTIGQVIKPQKRMHEDELMGDPSITSNGSVVSGSMGMGNSDLSIAGGIASSGSQKSFMKYGNARPALYSTSGGKVSVVGLNDTVSVPEARAVLENRGIGAVIGATQRLDMNTGNGNAETEDYTNASNVITATGSTYNNMTDFLGIYGYAARTVFGKANQDNLYIENSSYSTSMGRTFWDQEIGGLGGEISEIFRRFIPKRGQNDEYYNPIRNTMPEWMPGENYFTNFQIGDPYVKVKAGEERLPGEGYERLNGIDVFDMRIGSSSIGKTKEEIVSHYLNEDPILSDTMAEDVTEEGTAIHKKIEKEWLDSGYAIETEGQIEDKANNIVGFYDARVVDESAPGGQAIKDIKTVSDNVFKQVKRDGIREDHKRQVNYYLWSLNLQRGGIYYVNRDTGETMDLAFDFDKKAFNSTMKNVYDAREFIMNGIQDGTVSRGDLYNPVDRMKILGDVAPYSEEYKQMASIVSRSRLSKEEEEEVKQIRDRVSAQKKPLRTYDYKFRTADLVKEKVEVKRMYDYNTIYLNGYEAPMRFAGLDVRVGDTEKEKKEIAEYMNDLFDSGSNLTIGVDKASNAQTKSGSIRAVVYKNGRNINKEMIDRGYAKINEEDDSAAAINGRYNAVERFVGSVWETFAHADTPLHTKFLQVRSPLESYERERVYGKQFTEWTDPVQDFIKPLVIDRNVNRGFLSGIVWGGVIGAMFGTRKAGRMVSAIVGATVVTAGKAGKAYYEATNNEKWKPERVRKDNEISEYMDMLKYIKSKKLYNDYADKAMAEDGINVRSFIGSKQSQGRGRKNEKYELQNIKQNVKSMGTLWGSIASIIQGDTETLVNPFGNEKEELHKINQKIEERASHRELLTGFTRSSKNIDWRTIDRIKALQTLQTYVGNSNDDDNDLATQISTNKPKYVNLADIGDLKRNRAKMISGIDREIGELAEESNITNNVVKAIQYYNESEQTMYGYEKGDPITNLLAAMPKRDRDYFNLFVDAPEEDRLKILELAPKYMRRSLEASWKIDPEAKPSLEAYFGQRALPDANWAGWNENVNLNVVRVKMLKKADLDFSDVNVWKDDIKQANAAGEIPIPRLDVRANANRIKNDLYDILGKTGIRDLQIEMQYSNTDSNVDLDLKYDTRKKIEQQLQEYENDLVG